MYIQIQYNICKRVVFIFLFNMDEKKRSAKYLLWKNNRLEEILSVLKERLQDRDVAFVQMQASFEKKIQVLTEELEATKVLPDGLRVQIQKRDGKIIQLENEKKLLEKRSKLDGQKLDEVVISFKKQIKANEDIFSKTLQQEKNLANDTESRIQEGFEESMKSQKSDYEDELRVQKERMQAIIDSEVSKVLKLQQQLAQTELEFKQTVAMFEKKVDERDKMIKNLDDTLCNMKYEAEALQYIHKGQLDRLEQKIGPLNTLLNKEKKEVLRLHGIIQQKTATIKSKQNDITNLKREKATVVSQLLDVLEMKTMLLVTQNEKKKQILALEKENQDQAKILKTTTSHLNEARIMVSYLEKANQNLRSKVQTNKTAHLKEELSKHKTLLLRAVEDIQACMVDIENPKELKQRVMDLQKHITVHFDKTAEFRAKCKKAVAYHKEMHQKDIEHCSKMHVSQSRERTHLGKRLDQAHLNLSTVRSFYINLLNQHILSEYKLQQELRDIKAKLQKAITPAPEKIKSWINKTVFSSSPPAGGLHEEVEEPVLYAEDWLPLGLPDFTEILSHGYVNTGVQAVKQVVESLPPVDI